jgi:hypothetical protein
MVSMWLFFLERSNNMKIIDNLLECSGWFKTSASTSEDRSCPELESIRRDFRGTANPKEPHTPKATESSAAGALTAGIVRAYRALLWLLSFAKASPRKAGQATRPILMCFSQLAGLWYCSFFRDDSLKDRLPRKLKFRDSAKIHLAAERGNAELNSPEVSQELERAIKSGYGKIWLRLSDEQITTLE